MYMNPLKTHKPWLKHFVVGCWAFPSTCQAFKRSLFIWIAINAIKNQFIQWWNPRDLEVLFHYLFQIWTWIELRSSNWAVKDFFRIEKLDLIWKSKFEWFERFRELGCTSFRDEIFSIMILASSEPVYLLMSKIVLKVSKSIHKATLWPKNWVWLTYAIYGNV